MSRKFGCWLLICLLLGACSTADTISEASKEVVNNFRTSDGGYIIVFAPINVRSASSMDSAQAPENSPANRTDPSLDYLAGGAEALMGGLSEILGDVGKVPLKPSDATQAKRDEDKIPVMAIKKPIIVGIYDSSHEYDLKAAHSKMFTWLNESGEYYGTKGDGSVKFVWPGCSDFTVPDASKTTTRDGTLNQAQAYYFSGMDQRDHRTPEGHPDHNDASIFSDPSCKATKVMMYYNK